MDELNPCPFCGAAADLRRNKVVCTNNACGVEAWMLRAEDSIRVWNTRPREDADETAFQAGKVWERTTGPVTQAMYDLIAKWEKTARDHGVRQFTGNDHLLFANELTTALTAALGKSNG